MEENERNIPFFEELVRIRKDKDLDLNQIAEKSRIQRKYLEAIEAGRFDDLPDIYDKLFFQTYLNFLKLHEEDEKRFLEEFRRFRKISEPQHTTTIRRIKTQKSNPHLVDRLKRLYIIAPIFLIVLIIVIMALNSTRVGDSSESVKELSARQVAETLEHEVKQNEDKPLKKESTSIPVASESASQQIKAKLTATEFTWLRMIKDKKDTSEYSLQTNHSVTLQADSTLEFLVGKANGISFIINQKPVGVLGKAGEVISYMKVTDKGIVGLRLKKVHPKNESNDTSSVN